MVGNSLTQTLENLNYSFKPGIKVLIKPNLMSPAKPERAITTHPSILEELCKILKASSAEIIIGESSFYNTRQAFDVCGIAQLDQYAQLINFENVQTRPVFLGNQVGDVPLPEILFNVDCIINVAKMKTHGLTGATLCVKNLYGCIPGVMKQSYHKALQKPRAFSYFLIQLHNKIAPSLNIIDGVMGLEGEGPGASGKPISSNLIFAGESACAVDIIASETMGFKANEIYTNRFSEIRRDEIETVGSGCNEHILFKKPLSANFPYLIYFAEFLPKSKINFYHDRCVQCRLCEEKCPAAAISFHPKPICDHKLCIRCFCCMEICPQSAIFLQEHWIRNNLRRIIKKVL
jgi:uncharacterized protein (DUF362 family)/NAD-dependent dihydropyrimidine dehydrogenase PreA subunit